MNHPIDRSLFVFLVCVLIGSISTNNEISSNVSSRSSRNVSPFDLAPLDNFELTQSMRSVRHVSDRTKRSTFYNSRSSLDIDAQPTNDITSSKLLINSMNAFTFKLFNYLMNKYDNIVISPISLYSNLIALHAASSGTTEAQLSRLLALSGVSDKQIAVGYRTILDTMDTSLSGQNQLKLLNTMLVDSKINVSPSYLQKTKKYYNMAIQSVEFSTQSEHIYQYVNNLVNTQTDGNIRTIMDERPDPLSKLLIVNAVHFQGVWSKSFNPKDTSPMTFKNRDTPPTRVRMMKMVNEFRSHCDNARSRAPNPPLCSIQIPYAGEQLSMQIIQSANTKTSLKDSVERRLGTQLLRELDAKMQVRLIELGLPSFRLEDTHELREPMDFLGANSMFTKDRANLDKFLERSSSSAPNASATSDKKDTNVDLFVNQFTHKASIAVDEKGTVASAATSVLIGNRSGANKFYVDRPFIFLIRDNRSGVILFIGRINNLEQQVDG